MVASIVTVVKWQLVVVVRVHHMRRWRRRRWRVEMVHIRRRVVVRRHVMGRWSTVVGWPVMMRWWWPVRRGATVMHVVVHGRRWWGSMRLILVVENKSKAVLEAADLLLEG